MTTPTSTSTTHVYITVTARHTTAYDRISFPVTPPAGAGHLLSWSRGIWSSWDSTVVPYHEELEILNDPVTMARLASSAAEVARGDLVSDEEGAEDTGRAARVVISDSV